MPVKAFNLLPVLENIEFKIQCFESSGNMLYLGTCDGLVLEYAVEERTDVSNNTVYVASVVCQKNLNSKKTVSQIKAASALGRVLVLTDNNLYLLDSYSLTPVSTLSRLKNVSSFCINENPNNSDPFTLQFCIGKKKCLQIFNLHEDRLVMIKEISTAETPVNMSMDGQFICIATGSQYCIYNMESTTCQDLFPCDSVAPIIQRISKEEFLLAGPGNLGMFVTSKGTSERPPIQWSEGTLSVAFYYPYVLTITTNFICIYSLIDQMHKQTVLLTGGCLLGNFDGQMYVATESSVQCLMPQPWSSQVLDLLDDGSIEEAIALMEHSGGAGMTAQKFLDYSQMVFQKAGFIKLSKEDYKDAQDYFVQGKLDIRELISLFPGYLVHPFVRSQPPLHQMADINQAFHGDAEKIKRAKYFVEDYFMYLRNSGQPITHKLELDSTLLKLYSESDVESLIGFLNSEDVMCSLDNCIPWLERKGQYSAIALLYRCFNRIDDCLNILSKLFEGEISDEHFGGITELVEVIIASKDANLVFRYADFVLERDAKEGLRLFCATCQYLNHDKVLKILAKHPNTKCQYLRHLIYSLKIDNGKYHTLLALDYIDELIGCPENRGVRDELKSLLIFSSLYDPRVVLSKLQQAGFMEEMATVYGLLGDHEKALKLLVCDLRDFEAATRYCVDQESKSTSSQNIYIILLRIYLDPNSSSYGDESEVELGPALALLEQHATKMDLKEVIELLPDNWSVNLLSQYLRAALRETAYKNNMMKLQNSLIKSEYNQKQFLFHKLCSDMGPIILNSSRICCVCQKGFKECSFMVYPNGVMTHRSCAKDPYVCPLTGTVFKSRSAPNEENI